MNDFFIYIHKNMIFNFRWAFEFIFKSFDVAWDTKLLEKLANDWVRFLMLVKRHWIYSIIHSWRVLFVIAIWFANVYLLTFANSKIEIIPSIIAWFLSINIIYWVFIVILFIYRFYKIQWSVPYVQDVHSAIKKSKESDVVFTRFFNQTIFLFVVLFILSIFTSFTWLASLFWWWAFGFWVGLVNSFLLIIQTLLFYSYLKKMINQEMDFKIIIPWEIIFYNQRWILWDSQSMNANKIKTMNSSYRWLIGSFFNYGDIIVLSEWDQKDNWEMTMDYIGSPVKTLAESQKVLNNDLALMEKEVNVLLKRFKSEIWIDNIDTIENKTRLRKYVLNNESKIKEIFDKGDDETKNEIREMYILLQENNN